MNNEYTRWKWYGTAIKRNSCYSKRNGTKIPFNIIENDCLFSIKFYNLWLNFCLKCNWMYGGVLMELQFAGLSIYIFFIRKKKRKLFSSKKRYVHSVDKQKHDQKKNTANQTIFSCTKNYNIDKKIMTSEYKNK